MAKRLHVKKNCTRISGQDWLWSRNSNVMLRLQHPEIVGSCYKMIYLIFGKLKFIVLLVELCFQTGTDEVSRNDLFDG